MTIRATHRGGASFTPSHAGDTSQFGYINPVANLPRHHGLAAVLAGPEPSAGGGVTDLLAEASSEPGNKHTGPQREPFNQGAQSGRGEAETGAEGSAEAGEATAGAGASDIAEAAVAAL
jgi:hypothetical protein